MYIILSDGSEKSNELCERFVNIVGSDRIKTVFITESNERNVYETVLSQNYLNYDCLPVILENDNGLFSFVCTHTNINPLLNRLKNVNKSHN